MLPHIRDIEVAIDYLFGRLSNVARKQNVRLLILMDGDRQAVYQGADGAPLYQTGALALNALAAQAARRHGISFIDLHPRFRRHWRDHHLRFDFELDNHWNQLGHAVAASVIEEFVKETNLAAVMMGKN